MSQSISSVRVALFSGSDVGLLTLHNLLLIPGISVVGVCWDDPRLVHSNAKRRFWRHGFSEVQRLSLPLTATALGIPCYSGSIKTSSIRRNIAKLAPDICVMAGFGQRITPKLIAIPQLGFWNCHPDAPHDSGTVQFPGPQPYESLLAAGHKEISFALLLVNDGPLDSGNVVARSKPIRISHDANVRLLRKELAPFEASFIARHVSRVVTEHRSHLTCLTASFRTPIFANCDHKE